MNSHPEIEFVFRKEQRVIDFEFWQDLSLKTQFPKFSEESKVMQFDEAADMKTGRAHYFKANGLGDGGYNDRWAKLQAGPIPIYIPNTAARVRAIRFHDLHHVLTGYNTTWTGEAEIGAWELASGCADHYAAWVLNLWAMAIGLFLAPSKIYTAFRRGRISTNLYRKTINDELLETRLGELRQQLKLNQEFPAPQGHYGSFILWSLASLLWLLFTWTLFLSPLLGLAWTIFSFSG
jgi:hypothetical protein